MKGFILWTAVVAFLFVAVTAVNMHQYVIALVTAALAFACCWATPSGQSSKRKHEHANWW